MFSKLCDWRSCLVIVRPETVIRWHRAGWRLFWKYKSRAGRPPIPAELRQLIRQMADGNPVWGEERIANELFLKLGLRVSPRTVRKYMPKRPAGHTRGGQSWATFLLNHAESIIACDFFVTVTATFRLLYVFIVIHHGARRLLHINVTTHPTAAWTLQQLRELIGFDTHQFLLHDRDSIFARHWPNTGQISGPGWWTELFLAIGPDAEARRARALPLIAEDETRVPDHFASGPELPADE